MFYKRSNIYKIAYKLKLTGSKMRTFSCKYTNDKDLKKYIEENTLKENKNILLQIFTGVCNIVYIENLIQAVKEMIPHINIIGTTTDGEIIGNEVTEYSTVLSFSTFEKTKIATHFMESGPDSYKTAKALIDKFDPSSRAKVAISFTSGLDTNGEAYLNAFNDYDQELVVAGGLAGDNAQFKQTIVFTQDKILTPGVVIALLYNPTLRVNTNASFGWENIGKTMTITKSKDNIVYEIDHTKAVDIYEKYLGEDIALQLPKTGIEFPLIIQKNHMHIPRAVISKQDDGSLIFAGNLNEGDKVTFGYGNIESILNYPEYINTHIHQAESVFVYSCMARKALLGSDTKHEIAPLSHLSSISGFFTYGEFYYNHNIKKSMLLNQTMTLLCMCENSAQPYKNQSLTKKIKPSHRKSTLTLQALSHLISQSTLELDELNNSLQSKIEAAVKKNEQQDKLMYQQSRLAQMGEMLSMIAHQWRQPLAAISATSALIKLKASMDKLDNDTAIQKALDISKFSQHLSTTIDDFRDFFNTHKECKNTNLNDIVNSVLQITESAIGNKNILLQKELNCHKTFKSYPNELKQVILNLLKNAEDTLLEKKIKNPTIIIATYMKESNYILEISDNAGGVPDNIIDKIFDPYFSTKIKKNGTGIGLYMSKIIIEEHCSGKITVENGADGAIFKVILKAPQNVASLL